MKQKTIERLEWVALALIAALVLAVALQGCTKDKPAPPPVCECAQAVPIPSNANTD